jgi:prophage antirepressor-like protein/DNA-directed RNA polymerase subunit RPC12/RpoP
MALVFNHGTQSITLTNYGDNDQVYFKAKDIATFLGYTNTTKAIRDHVWDKNKLTVAQFITKNESFSPTKLDPQTMLINEAGLYQLIFASKMQYAQAFQEWVFNTVLPTIRKTGTYKIDNKIIRQKLTFKIENEFQLHTKVVDFIKNFYPHTLMTICNAELSNTSVDKRIKCAQLGYVPGTFDLIINNLHKSFSGFAIEFKSPTGLGVVSIKQSEMKTHYEANNFKTLISNSYDQIITEIIEYMRNTRVKCSHCSSKFKSSQTLKNHCKYFHRIL